MAEASGVSIATASCALRNDPKVKASTRKRVQEVAASLGYTPNEMLSKVMTQVRTDEEIRARETLGYICTDDRFRRKMYEAASQHARNRGCSMDFFNYNEYREHGRRMNDVLQARGIRGLVLGPFLEDFEDLPLDWERYAPVTIGETLTKPGILRIRSTIFHDILFSFRFLESRNYHRIGVVANSSRLKNFSIVVEAASLYHNKHISRKLQIPPLIDDQLTQEKVARWYEKHSPDAVITGNNEPIALFTKNGIEIPRDMGLINMAIMDSPDDSFKVGYPGHFPTASGFHPNYALMAKVSVDNAINLLESNQIGLSEHPNTISIAGTWIEKSSTR